MKQTLKLTALLLLSLWVPYSSTLAQEVETQEVTEEPIQEQLYDNPFQVEMIIGTQSPWDKSLPVTVKVKPNIDATRVNITWDTALGLEITDKEQGTYVAIAKGEVYTREVKIKPIQPGTYTLSASATDWGYGDNVTTTTSRIVTFGDNFVTVPQTADYTTAIGIKYAIILLGGIVLGTGLFVAAKLGLSKLKEWLKPPEL